MKLISHDNHRFAVDWYTDILLDSALAEVTTLDPDQFDRYSNPFEQKYALRDKFNLPKSVDALIVRLEYLKEEISQLFNIELHQDETRHYTGVFKYEKGDKLDVHVDAGINPINGLRKHVTAILYLGSPIGEEGSSDLELWAGTSCTDPEPELWGLSRDISAAHGHLVIFENTDYAWHGVPVHDIEAPRIVLTVSFLSKAIDAFKNQRQRAFFMPRPSENWDKKLYKLRDIRADSTRYSEAYRV